MSLNAKAKNLVKSPALKRVVAVALASGVLWAWLVWYPFVFSLTWPGLVLARLGIPYGIILPVFLLGGGLLGLIWWARHRAWTRILLVSVAIPAAYGYLAFYFAARAAVPLPSSTPYDAVPTQRAAYLENYESGYREGMLRSTRTYCFMPEAQTRGAYDGSYQGHIIFYRMLGRDVPADTKRWLEISAIRDGVKPNP